MLKTLQSLYRMVKNRPAPAFTKQRATAVTTSVVGVVTTLGILPALDGNRILSVANIVISVLFVAWGAAHTVIALWSTQDTTPISDPVSAQGKPLVPAASSDAPIATVPTASIPTRVADGTPAPTSTDLSLLPDGSALPADAGGVD